MVDSRFTSTLDLVKRLVLLCSALRNGAIPEFELDYTL